MNTIRVCWVSSKRRSDWNTIVPTYSHVDLFPPNLAEKRIAALALAKEPEDPPENPAINHLHHFIENRYQDSGPYCVLCGAKERP